MKTILLDDIGEVTIKTSSRAKRLILAIQPDGTPRVTAPPGVPMIFVKKFIKQNTTWLKKHSNPQIRPYFMPGDMIGQYHKLRFKTGTKLSSRVGDEAIVISLPENLHLESPSVQAEVKKAATRALRRQAEEILPSRLYEYAQTHGYRFEEVRCKALKTRWGSCSSEKIINLNIWLMQLPDDLVEYVLIHELTHLRHQHHQPAFWSDVAAILPDYKQRRKQLKLYRPALLHPSELP